VTITKDRQIEKNDIIAEVWLRRS